MLCKLISLILYISIHPKHLIQKRNLTHTCNIISKFSSFVSAELKPDYLSSHPISSSAHLSLSEKPKKARNADGRRDKWDPTPLTHDPDSTSGRQAAPAESRVACT